MGRWVGTTALVPLGSSEGKAHQVGRSQRASTLRIGRGTDGLVALQARDPKRGSVGRRQRPVSDSMGFARVRVSTSEFDRPGAQSVVVLRRWQSTKSRCDEGRCDAEIDQDGGGALFWQVSKGLSRRCWIEE